jgi:hypothetical protein
MSPSSLVFLQGRTNTALVAVPTAAVDCRGISGVWIVGAVVAVAAAVLPIGVIDAICGLLATVPSVGVTDRVCVVRVGAEVAEVFSCLPIPKVGRFSLDNAGNKQCEKSWYGGFRNSSHFVVVVIVVYRVLF